MPLTPPSPAAPPAAAIRFLQYQVSKVLGKGSFASVFLCSRADEAGKETQFALKVFSKSVLRKQKDFKRVGGKMVVVTALQKVQKEIAIMKKIAHPNLVRLFEVPDAPLPCRSRCSAPPPLLRLLACVCSFT
jgi:serine/threonine protein kinase